MTIQMQTLTTFEFEPEWYNEVRFEGADDFRRGIARNDKYVNEGTIQELWQEGWDMAQDLDNDPQIWEH